MSAKFIFVTGGVVSSLGKGLAAASIGCLLEARGLRINLMKFDPYLNAVSYTHLLGLGDFRSLGPWRTVVSASSFTRFNWCCQ